VIYGDRIKQARELIGMTQTELANRIGVKQSAISQIEKGEFEPSEDLLRAIANETGFLPSFFEKEPIDNFPIGSLSYRSKRSITAREETKAYQYAKVIYEQIKRMIVQVADVPNIRLPKLNGENPNIAAQVTRASLGIAPDTPIKNLIHLAEINGIYIFNLPLILPKIDAFSTWAELDEERPIIAISYGKPMDRIRFSIAHEMGHLVLHQAIRNQIKIVEKEANEFASEFLLPDTAMRNELIPPLSLTGLARMKARWGVSMQAIIYRAKDLKIITERQFKYLNTQMAAHGWKKREPTNLDATLEIPHLVRRMVEALYKNPEEYALDMGLSLEKATEFYVYA